MDSFLELDSVRFKKFLTFWGFSDKLRVMQYYFFQGLSLSSFCLGTVQFGLAYGIANQGRELGPAEIRKFLEKAVERGVNYFDLAADYGRAEEVVGDILGKVKKQKELIFATKLAHIKDRTPTRQLIEKRARQSLENSLKKLRTEHLDIVCLHQAELFFQFPEPFLKVLTDFQKKGLISCLGISLYQPSEADQALKYPEFSVFQVPYSALNRGFEEAGKLALLKAKGKLVNLRSIFLQGLVFLEPNDLVDYFQPIKKQLADFYQLIDKNFSSRAEFFLQYVLSKNFGPLVLGVYSLEQLLENLAFFEKAIDRQKIERIAEQAPVLPAAFTDPRNWKGKI